MDSRPRHAARPSPTGFTMVELLVAMAISSFLVVTVFFVMTSSSRTFRVQTDVAQASDRLNYAMDTIKADIRRASFLTVPNAYLPQDRYPWYRQVCAPPGWMSSPNGVQPAAHAVWVREGSGGGAAMEYYQPAPARTILSGRQPDQLLLLGAYRTDRPFRPVQMQSGTSQITLPNGEFTDAEMRYMFDDAWIAVTTPAGGMQFLAVRGVTASPTLPETALTLASPLVADPPGTGLEACNFTGFGGGTFEVVPLHFVRYSVVVDPDDRESTVLVREELDSAAGNLNTVMRHVVARDVVDMQFWFDGVAAGGASTDVQIDGEGSGDWTDDQGGLSNDLLAGDGNAQPENVRFAYVQLSTRFDTTLTRVAPDVDGSGDPQGLREYIELLDCQGATCRGTNEFTRLITMRSEVELPNVGLANTRTLP